MYATTIAGDSPNFSYRSLQRAAMFAALLCAGQLVSAASILAYDFDNGAGA